MHIDMHTSIRSLEHYVGRLIVTDLLKTGADDDGLVEE
jgi:hypothetical protein